MIRVTVYCLDEKSHTLVYWVVSCPLVDVAEWGIVSILQMPGAEHKALQECSCLGCLNE